MYPFSFLTAMLGVPASGFPFAWTFDPISEFDLFEGMIPQRNNISLRQLATEGINGLAPPSFKIHTGYPLTWLAISHLFRQSAAKFI